MGFHTALGAYLVKAVVHHSKYAGEHIGRVVTIWKRCGFVVKKQNGRKEVT
jgi:hypothetical protein